MLITFLPLFRIGGVTKRVAQRKINELFIYRTNHLKQITSGIKSVNTISLFICGCEKNTFKNLKSNFNVFFLSKEIVQLSF